MTLSQFADWNRRAAELLACAGDDSFFAELIAALRALVDVDYPQVWLYCRDRSPRTLFYDIAAREQEAQIDSYRNGAYRQDPFYLAVVDNQCAAGVYRLAEIGAREFEQSDYCRSYYAGLDARDEIVLLVELDETRSLHLCLMRSRDAREFHTDELELLRAVEPVVRNLVLHHMHQLEQKQVPLPPQWIAVARTDVALGDSINRAFNLFGRSVLSGRERDVLGLMLRGSSTRHAAEKLGIAVDTLRKHRKNIYEKLDVSSQNELFSLFLNAICAGDCAANEDPLSVYCGSAAGR